MVLGCLQIRQALARYYTTKTTNLKSIPTIWDHRTPDNIISSSPEEAVTLQLLSWGRGASGQLGSGAEGTRIYPATVGSLLLPSSFTLSSPIPGRLPASSSAIAGMEGVKVGISCGLFHSGLLVNGKLWIWGKGDGGRLGLGHEDSISVPTLNTCLESNVIQSIALGGLHSIALDSRGQIKLGRGSAMQLLQCPGLGQKESYLTNLWESGQPKNWGYGGFGALGHSIYRRELLPRMVKGLCSEEICHIATAGTHTAAISKSGEVYSWGRDEGDGRLGLGPGRGPDQAGGLSIPSKVKELPLPVAAVACGGFFTMALTEEGQLWNWGANSNCELGRGDKVGGWKPQSIPSLQDVRIIQVASGGYHSLALTDKGEVLSWGHGGQGQLGHSSIQNQKVPMRIEVLANEKVTYIACGGSSSAAITEDGKLYMWGNAKDSQLGIPGLHEVQSTPLQVQFLTEDDGSMIHKVLSVAIGASHALCLVMRSAC